MTPLVDIHTHRSGTDQPSGVKMVRSYRLGAEEELPPAPFSAGIHPWDAGNLHDTARLLDRLREMHVAAIGEIGLDYSHAKETITQQTELFEAQLEIAIERQLPVVIHCVKAFEQVMTTLHRHSTQNVLLHGYIGSPEQTRRVIDAGYYISAGATSLQSPKTVNSLRTTPLDRLFLETDDADVSIEAIYRQASDVLGIPLPDLRVSLYENFKKLFPTL